MKKKNQQFQSKILIMLMSIIFFFSCSSGSESAKDDTESDDVQLESNVESTSDFQISLAQWSLHQSFFGTSSDSVKLDPMDFPSIAAGYGIKAVELVNTFYFDKAEDIEYLTAFKQNCDDAGVTVLLIMCDALGNLGDANAELRKTAVENHYKWVDAAKFLGAHSIRVNAAGQGTAEELAANAADGLTMLGKYGASKDINIIVENHGGFSSNGTWLSGVMKQVGMDNVGTLPDFGNFCIERDSTGCIKEYDRYQGMTDLMPYAKGVSAKSNEFDADGNELKSDFLRIMKIVKESGYKGYIGIEYEGDQLSEDEGIKATKKLLEKVFKKL